MYATLNARVYIYLFIFVQGEELGKCREYRLKIGRVRYFWPFSVVFVIISGGNINYALGTLPFPCSNALASWLVV